MYNLQKKMKCKMYTKDIFSLSVSQKGIHWYYKKQYRYWQSSSSAKSFIQIGAKTLQEAVPDKLFK